MYIARILYPVEVLGPGKRIGIWLCGCRHNCKGCSNPELWDFQEKYKTSVERVIALIMQICKNHIVDGFTITGGEPFEQSEALNELIVQLYTISSDIIVYTGYTLQELKDKKSPYIQNIFSKTAVLIDGRYIESLNNGAILRGSDNQKIHILNAEYQEKYKKYLEIAVNQIQNFTSSDGIISVGIHKSGFKTELNNAMMQKGLVEEYIKG